MGVVNGSNHSSAVLSDLGPRLNGAERFANNGDNFKSGTPAQPPVQVNGESYMGHIEYGGVSKGLDVEALLRTPMEDLVNIIFFLNLSSYLFVSNNVLI